MRWPGGDQAGRRRRLRPRLSERRLRVQLVAAHTAIQRPLVGSEPARPLDPHSSSSSSSPGAARGSLPGRQTCFSLPISCVADQAYVPAPSMLEWSTLACVHISSDAASRSDQRALPAHLALEPPGSLRPSRSIAIAVPSAASPPCRAEARIAARSGGGGAAEPAGSATGRSRCLLVTHLNPKP